MNIKKILIIIGILSITGLLVWNGCGHRPCFCSDDFPDRVLKRMDRHVSRLDLTPDQQEEYDKIRADVKTDLIKFRDDKMKVMRYVTAELKEENPDLGKISEYMKKSHHRNPDKIHAYMDRTVDFYNILDQEQKAKVIERMRDFTDHFECD